MQGAGTVIFVAGERARCGKTVLACGLIRALNQKGLIPVATKPIETGCGYDEKNNLIGVDGARLWETCQTQYPKLLASPFRFAVALSPPEAADAAGLALTLDDLRTSIAELTTFGNIIVVEGPAAYDEAFVGDSSVAALADAIGAKVLLICGDDSNEARPARAGLHRVRAGSEPSCQPSHWVVPFSREDEDLDTLASALIEIGLVDALLAATPV